MKVVETEMLTLIRNKIVLLLISLISPLILSQNYEFDYFVEQQTKILSSESRGKIFNGAFLINSNQQGYTVQFLKSAENGSFRAILTDRIKGFHHYFDAEVFETSDLVISLKYTNSRKFPVKNSTRAHVKLEKIGSNLYNMKFYSTKKSKKPKIEGIFELEKADKTILFFSFFEMRYVDENVIINKIRSEIPLNSGLQIRKYTAIFEGLAINEIEIKNLRPVKLVVPIDNLKILK